MIKKIIYKFVLLNSFCSSILLEVLLDKSTPKCYVEEVVKDTLFIAEVRPRNIVAEVIINDLESKIIYFKDKGANLIKTAFTTSKQSSIQVCINSQNNEKSSVSLRILTGAQAKDFSQIAKSKDLDPLVNELILIESVLTDYYQNQIKLLGSEAETRQLVELTHKRILGLGLANGIIIVGLTVAVISVLQSFFKSKKLI